MDQFFSSLEQVEKRLKLEENQSKPSNFSPSLPIQHSEKPSSITRQDDTGTLGTPIYLHYNPSSATACAGGGDTLEESEPPREFLTNSFDFPPTLVSPRRENGGKVLGKVSETEKCDIANCDDIESLIQLLGLSDSNATVPSAGNDGCFYGKIVGVKGPKSDKEVGRLERWIEHYSNGGKVREPFRLAHLLLAKAAFVHSHGFGGFEFPSTVDDFLQNDPPAN